MGQPTSHSVTESGTFLNPDYRSEPGDTCLIQGTASTTRKRRTVAGLSALGGALTLLICLLAPPSPVASQGIVPTAMPAPEEIAPPPLTLSPAPAQPSDTSRGNESEEHVKGLFFEIEGDPSPGPGAETPVSRFAGIDFGQFDPSLGSVSSPQGIDRVSRLTPQTVTLNLFEDAAFTGRIEHVEPTASGYAFWGGLDGVDLGTMTMVVNGGIVVGVVRTS